MSIVFVDASDWQYNYSQNAYGIDAFGEDWWVQSGSKPWSISAPDLGPVDIEDSPG